MWGMRRVSEDYLGLNDQLVLVVSHSKLLKSHASFRYVCIAAFTLPQKLARLNRAGLGPDLAHFSGTVYIATKTSSVDPSPVRGARLYVLPFYSFLVE